MYKLIARLKNARKNSTFNTTIRHFDTAVEARDWYNEHFNEMEFIEIYEVSKWTRERLNQHAQLEEECAALGKE